MREPTHRGDRVTAPPRVAISQRVVDLSQRDERRDELDQRWPQLLQAHGYVPVPVPNLLTDVVSWLQDLAIAMIILTGGNDLQAVDGAADAAPERDATEAQLIDYATQHALPLLGVCRGMQMMVCHSGGALRRSDAHVGTPHNIEVLPTRGHVPLRGGPVNSFHNWVVDPASVPEHFSVAAVGTDGTVEAIHHQSLPQFGVMWHPERAPYDAGDMQLLDHLYRSR
jgi:N5-(cytidine 5'-diphosphoramidyl)-L-glutamine hydrolase